MKYLAIDIETTGLNPEKHQILSFGAVVEDTDNPVSIDSLPSFYRVISGDIKEGASPFALSMNSGVLRDIADGKGVSLYDFRKQLVQFIRENFGKGETILLAGANIEYFDLKFLEKISWNKEVCRSGIEGGEMFSRYRRVLDPSLLFLDIETDVKLPGLQECLIRSGIGSSVTHHALEDARDVVKVFRRYYSLPN